MQVGSAQPGERQGDPTRIASVIVTCAQRKGALPERQLHARTLPRVPVGDRLKEWTGRLERAAGPRVVAGELYKGEHWTVAAGLRERARSVRCAVELWVASAGYGLVSDRSMLVPYAATFVAGHPDSVVAPDTDRPSAGRRKWWSAMAAWGGPDAGRPRSLADLAVAYPMDPMVVAVSAAYLDALFDDLAAARRRLSDPALLMIVSAGTRAAGGLSDNLLPIDASAETVLGGSRTSINARIASWLVATAPDHEFDFRRIAVLAVETLSKGTRVTPRRRVQTDDAILAYIKTCLAANPLVRKSRLLRNLRDGDLACEQGRFSRLYEQARREVPA
jgi:hypothetical protein